MLQSLREEIRMCYSMAEEAARQARAAPTATLRADYLGNELVWLRLARSYEFQQRLTLFVNEKRKRQNDGDRGAAEVNAEGSAAETACVNFPGPGRQGNDPRRLHKDLIAIVDDDQYARAGLRTLIESRDHEVVTFASAEEYLASPMRERTACLILDVHLPGMSGPDLQDHLVAAAHCAAIVFATGRFEEHVRKRVTEAGALGYLAKPCNAQALLDCIEKVFAQGIAGEPPKHAAAAAGS